MRQFCARRSLTSNDVSRPPARPQVIDYKGLTYIEDKEDRDAAAKALAPVMGRYGVIWTHAVPHGHCTESLLSLYSGPS
jgi:hypothetical protein